MPFGEAFLMALKMIVCSGICFTGAFWILANWFDRRISGREGVLLLAALAALMSYATSLTFRGGPGIIILAAVVFGGAAGLRLLAGRAERRLTSQLDEDEIAKYRQAIEDYPENPYAHSLLADVYRRLGRRELALAEYQAALDIDPSLRQESYWLERMRTEMEREARKQMACPRCGTPRQERQLACQECGRPYSSIETWSYAYRVADSRKKALWLAVAVGTLIVAGATAVFAPGTAKVGALAAVVVAPVVLIAMSRRIRQRTG